MQLYGNGIMLTKKKRNLRQTAKAYKEQTDQKMHIIRQGFITNAFNELIKNPEKTIKAISNLIDDSKKEEQTSLRTHFKDSNESLYAYEHNAVYKTCRRTALARFFEDNFQSYKSHCKHEENLQNLTVETKDIEINEAYQQYRENLQQQGFELKIGRFRPKDTNRYPVTNLIITDLKHHN